MGRYSDIGNNDTVLILIKKIGEHKVLFNLIVSVLLSSLTYFLYNEWLNNICLQGKKEPTETTSEH